MNEKQAAVIGRLWWVADNVTEAATWVSELLSRGAISVECRAPIVRNGSVDVLVTLRRDERADFVAGYPIDDEEWMNPYTLEPEEAQKVIEMIQRYEMEKIDVPEAAPTGDDFNAVMQMIREAGALNIGEVE